MALHHWAGKRGFDLSVAGLAGFDDPSRLTVLVSEDAHFSVRQAVRFLGLGDDAMMEVKTDENRRLDVSALREVARECRGDREVFCVVATAGTTPTGAVDPVEDIAPVVEEEGAWLHVDGAYGLAYRLVPEWASLFRGLDRAHTVAWDPHKQMGVPIPTSILFAQTRDLFRPLALFSHYWNRADSEGPNPGLKSIPSTRPMVALPLVASIRHQGLRKLRDRLRSPLEAIRGFYDRLLHAPDVELLHVPDTGILCFRVLQRSMSPEEVNRLQEQIYRTLQRRGKRMISVTRLGEKVALRAVAVTPAVTTDALLATLLEAQQIAGSFR
jgi:L-2,4-diaminobutyrate decarboxylase